MAFECEKRFVSKVLLLSIDLTIRDPIAVVKAGILLRKVHASVIIITYGLSNVPNF